MAIKIPSSHILDYSNELSKSNAIKNVDIAYNSYKSITGAILPQTPTTIHIYEALDTATGWKFTFIGSTSSDNPVPFELVSDTIDSKSYHCRNAEPWFIETDVLLDPVFGGEYTAKVKYFHTTSNGESTESVAPVEFPINIEYDKNAKCLKIDKGNLKFQYAYSSTYKEYLTKVEISISDFYLVESAEKVSIGSQDAKEKFALPSNGLSSVWCKHDDQDAGDLDVPTNFYAKWIGQKVIDRYTNGKEVWTIDCLVGDYYNSNGQLAISPEKSSSLLPLVFHKYDIVEPYISTTVGDKPLSEDNEGNAKLFQIIGVDFAYDGVPRQILTVQEFDE